MKTVILYATKHGCTQKAARFLAENFKEEVNVVNVKEDNIPDLEEYDNIIIGGSIYAGKIQKETKQLCVENNDILREKRLGIFICCGFEDKAEEQMKDNFAPEIYNQARARGYFGYEFYLDDMKFFEKMIVRAVSKVDQDQSSVLIENINEFADKMLE